VIAGAEAASMESFTPLQDAGFFKPARHCLYLSVGAFAVPLAVLN
jgi:hypothetical protein